MKKFLIALLIFILCFSLCGCGKKNSTENEETQQEYNITDWFSNDEMEQGENDGKFDAIDPEGVTLPDRIW